MLQLWMTIKREDRKISTQIIYINIKKNDPLQHSQLCVVLQSVIPGFLQKNNQDCSFTLFMSLLHDISSQMPFKRDSTDSRQSKLWWPVQCQSFTISMEQRKKQTPTNTQRQMASSQCHRIITSPAFASKRRRFNLENNNACSKYHREVNKSEKNRGAGECVSSVWLR